jgi:hypothetical protein
MTMKEVSVPVWLGLLVVLKCIGLANIRKYYGMLPA